MKKTILMIATFLAALASTPAYAEGTVMSLKDCVEQAYKNSPALKSVEGKTDGAAAAVKIAKSGLKPRLSLSETVSSTNNPTYSFMSVLNQREFSFQLMNTINDPEVTTNYNTKLSIMQPLSTGGYVRHGIRAASKASEAAEFEMARARQQVRFNVKTAYFRVIIAQRKVEVASSALETAKAHARITEDMFKNGMIVESDRLSAEVRVAEIEQMLLSSENDVRLAKAALLMSMGVDQGMEIEVDSQELEQPELSGEVGSYITTAQTSRPELEAMERAVAAKTSMISMASAAKKPQMFLMANYDLDNSSVWNNDGQSWFMGVGVSLNAFDGGEARSRIAQSRASVDELKWQREQLRQGIELEVRQAYMNVQTARKGMEVMKRAVEQAEASFKIVENRYKNGLAINVEVMAAETALTQARTALLGALYQYSVGIETLNFAAGVN